MPSINVTRAIIYRNSCMDKVMLECPELSPSNSAFYGGGCVWCAIMVPKGTGLEFVERSFPGLPCEEATGSF